MSLAVFNLPDVGEGLTEAEIVSWKVAPGDQVTVNQVICEIETAKSIVELPLQELLKNFLPKRATPWSLETQLFLSRPREIS
jgi:hypothetical protein